jgi:predicted enzyme related to lactoylglutathione lyase
MKKLINFFKKLFGKKVKNPIPTVTVSRKPKPSPTPKPTQIYSHNVNGMEEDIQKVCNTGVLTLYSYCENLESFCVVFADPQGNDYTTLAGKHFHDYSNNKVYYVQEETGEILELGRC